MLRLTALPAFLAFVGLALAAPPAAAHKSSDKKITWNIKMAGKFMWEASRINKSRKGLKHLPDELKGLGLTEYEQMDKRFKEDLRIILAKNRTHIFIAFGSTKHKATGDANRDAKPIKVGGRIYHRGWRRAALKAYKEEVRPYLTTGGARKVLITGHSMGGVMAAYVTRELQSDRAFDLPVRLVTFGTPRYTDDKDFFDLKKDFYVYTVEAAKKNHCVDTVVYDWQKGLRQHPIYSAEYRRLAGKKWKRAILAVPRNRKGDNVWHGRCETSRTNYNDLHNGWTYFHYISKKKQCAHVKLRKDCKATRSFID